MIARFLHSWSGIIGNGFVDVEDFPERLCEIEVSERATMIELSTASHLDEQQSGFLIADFEAFGRNPLHTPAGLGVPSNRLEHDFLQ